MDAIGLTQSVFLSAGSLGILYRVGRFQHGMERRHLVLDPLVAFSQIVGLGIWHNNYYGPVALLVLAGLVLNGTTAAVISCTHQRFPNNTGIASSLMIGFARGLGHRGGDPNDSHELGPASGMALLDVSAAAAGVQGLGHAFATNWTGRINVTRVRPLSRTESLRLPCTMSKQKTGKSIAENLWSIGEGHAFDSEAGRNHGERENRTVR